jgi:hypothetical protein
VPRSDQESAVQAVRPGRGGKLPSRQHQRPAANTVAADRRRLRHVLWLGGAACSGKTVVASRLCAGYGLAEYHADDSFERLRRRADPLLHAAFCRVGDLSGEALWAAPAAEQASDLLAFHREHFELVLGELLQTPPERPILVEGCCLLPECVAPLLSNRRQALWLVASAEFRRLHYRDRGELVRQSLAGCGDPAAAFERWMARDDALAEWRVAEARRRGLRWWWIDGRMAADETAARAAHHFGLAMRSAPPAAQGAAHA